MKKKISRHVLSLFITAITAVALVYAFWPKSLLVDVGTVEKGNMRVIISEQGRTRVRNTFVVSTPVAGRLQRVDVEPGDQVMSGETVIAQMLPVIPGTLDARSRAQANAVVLAAEASLRSARAEYGRTVADKDLADANLKRIKRLALSYTVSKAELDKVVREAHVAKAALGTAKEVIAMREAELENVRSNLIQFAHKDKSAVADGVISIHAPATGKVLRVMHKSASTLPVGEAILEIGNIEEDLEVVVELLSSDAVKVAPGHKVEFEDWGGEGQLNGIVDRVDPRGFTKVSALGVEEQRVSTIVRLTDPAKVREKLGHGYRVTAKILMWENDQALRLPASALFRDRGIWSVYLLSNGKAQQRQVEIGQNNGFNAEVLAGLEAGDQVVLYPSSDVHDGIGVKARTDN